MSPLIQSRRTTPEASQRYQLLVSFKPRPDRYYLPRDLVRPYCQRMSPVLALFRAAETTSRRPEESFRIRLDQRASS
jgi:hypothetical protein